MNSEEMKRRLLSLSFRDVHEILSPCDDKDVLHIEHEIGAALPMPYKQIMKVLGRGTIIFMDDMSMFYPEVLSLTKQAREEMEESSCALPDNVFVFASRYGDSYFFFNLDNLNDSPVYAWIGEENQILKVADTIWGFFENELEAIEKNFA